MEEFLRQAQLEQQHLSSKCKVLFLIIKYKVSDPQILPLNLSPKKESDLAQELQNAQPVLVLLLRLNKITRPTLLGSLLNIKAILTNKVVKVVSDLAVA